MKALIVEVGDRRCAIELTRAREVLRLPVVTPLPGSTSPVLGLVNVRGSIIPAFDGAALLDVADARPPAFLAVVDTLGGPAALSMSGMGRVVELADAADEPGGGAAGSRARVIVGDDDAAEEVDLIDIDALLLSLRRETDR